MSGTQSQAAAPRGMQRMPFPLESYQHSSVPLSAKRLLNFYSEQAPKDALTEAALIPTPGLQSAFAVGTGPILAVNDTLPNVVYVLSGTGFYRAQFRQYPPTVEYLGDVGSPDPSALLDPYIIPTIAVGSTACVVCIPPRAYTCGHESGNTLNQIGGDFPGALTVAHMDGYFGFTAYETSARFFLSQLLDPTNFDALDFAYADAVPNNLIRVIGLRGQFWLMGMAGHEVWYDAGTSGLETTAGTSFFPFRRLSGTVIPFGTSAPGSIAIADGSVWWLGNDATVYRTDKYDALRVSTHAIEQVINANMTTQAQALVYSFDGHIFYCLTVGDLTVCYDCATKVWHDRSSSADGTGPWQVCGSARLFDRILFGDSLAGQLLEAQPGSALDRNVAVLRQATFPPLWANTRRAFCARAELEIETGSHVTNGQVDLSWSDDGGYTFPVSRSLTGGAPGNRYRLTTTRLGSFRQRVFRLSLHYAPTLYAMDADVSAGDH